VPHHPPRQEPEPERAPWWKVRCPHSDGRTRTSSPCTRLYPPRQLASWFGSVDSEAAAAPSPSSDSNAVKGVYMYGDVGTVCCLELSGVPFFLRSDSSCGGAKAAGRHF
jgi:hypothetical protein